MKILVTGSREWLDPKPIKTFLLEMLDKYHKSDIIIVHGGCKGADLLAGFVAKTLGIVDVRIYPGNAAGILRNQQMLNEEHIAEQPIDICVGFHQNISASKGTRDMILRASNAGIETRLITGLPKIAEF